jgi:hypothetical protein
MSGSPVRRLPLPDAEPPYDTDFDDDTLDHRRPRGQECVQGTLALAFLLPGGVPAEPELPDLPRRLIVAGDAEEQEDADEFGPQPTGRSALPPPSSWASRVVQAIVEVLAGIRPAGQLVRWTTAEVYDDITARVLPSTATDGFRRGVVRSVHVSEPADGVAEVCALVHHGQRSTAVALRLEGMDGRWQCTALELG